MMNNTWYYTLSTIVQALASIFGLGGTFLVFKLQTLEKELREYREKSIRIMSYIEKKPERDYDSKSLIDISKLFLSRIITLDLDEENLDLLQDYGYVRKIWEISDVSFQFEGDSTYELKQRTLFFIEQKAKEFDIKVQYRLKLYKLALITGIILSTIMILALFMLSNSFYFSNKFLGYSEGYWINFITIFACIGIISVIVTAFYAIWGDK